MSECCLHSLRINRLGEIVERVDLKGANRIMIVRGDKDGDRHFCRPSLLDDFKAPAPRHLDIEKEQIDLRVFQGSENFPAIAAFRDNLDFLVVGQQKAEPFPGKQLVISRSASFQATTAIKAHHHQTTAP